MLVTIFSILMSIICCYFLSLTLLNIWFFRKNSFAPTQNTGPKVSVMVPARNEENNIAACLDSLLKQHYQNYEIIVLDDNSTDRTWRILLDYQKRHPDLLKIIKGKSLPKDWYGKPYALQQLSE